MGSCLSTPVDFEGEVSLYHFDLHRVVGKGAFGKVSISPSLSVFRIWIRSSLRVCVKP